MTDLETSVCGCGCGDDHRNRSVGAQQPRAVAIIHASVLDVRSGTLTPDATVVVRGRTIVSVGTQAPPSGAEVLDARGRVLMPGLIDAHAHTQIYLVRRWPCSPA